MTITLQSLALDRWVKPASGLVDIPSAVDGHIVACASSAGLNFADMVRHARETGGRALRRLTFHQRADELRALATHLGAHKEVLYRLAGDTGANKRDNAIDIEGGIGTLSAYASRGRRDLPDAKFSVEGDVEGLSKGGTFVGQHILSPLHGVAVQFSVLGVVGKIRPGVSRRRSRHRQACDGDRLCDRSAGPSDTSIWHSARRQSSTHLRAARRSVRPSRRPGRRGIHRFDRNLGKTAQPSQHCEELDPVRCRA